MASASNGASAGGYASRPAAVGRQSAPADSSACVASVPRPRASQDELSACHAQLLVCVHTIHIYVYLCVCVCVFVCVYIYAHIYVYIIIIFIHMYIYYNDSIE